MIKGAIWSCDRGGDGIEKLKYIRDRYIWSGINPVQEVYSRSNSWIAFENGDHWKVVGTSESSRGVRCNYAWIDSRASEEFVRCVIMRTLCCPFGPQHYEFFMPRSDNQFETFFK